MIDMTKGDCGKLILKFAFPMILGNIFQQIYNLVDSIVVGKFVGANALAAVGSSFAIVVFVTSTIIGLTMGVGTILAQFYGSGEIEKFKEATFTSFIFIGGVTIIIMIISLLGIDLILSLFNMPNELIKDSKEYLTIIIVGLIFTFIYNLATALLRSIGDSKRPLYFLIIASLINIILDLVFVLKFNMGVRGVAMATVIAQATSAVLSAMYVYKSVGIISFKKSDIRISKGIFRDVIKYSILTSTQQSIMNFGILIVQGLVNTFGATVMAAFAAGVKVDSIAYMPVQDFGNAFSTFVAQNKGAGKIDRVKDGVRGSIKIIIVFCVVISTLILIFSKDIMYLFINKNEIEVISLGAEYLSVVSIFYVLIGFLFMFYGLFRGLGHLKVSIVLTIVSLGTRVILAYILASTWLGERGIWWSIPIGWALADIIGIIYFHKNINSDINLEDNKISN
ncbi:MATE family efflux transporter [Romboutsia weinsteinii]|uniref:Probable multidrug resistance protein NorM n=1 Tax=Romboutsia weinsteinii TaxID=2020949 RepID=A0A371J0R3_9FIRM|nr:MATE family efflux transporter [Romboutsia weinsteinii]RDY26303.1 MATE family efflux transporter [Romboutsia weinsteinii]